MSEFLSFISHDRINRRYLFGALGVSIITLVVYKLLYPYPNMVMDSYYYVRAAANHADVNAWPIGYSRFLEVVGLISRSPLFLVIIQYLFLQVALLTLFFTIRLLYRPGRVASTLTFLFFFINPLFIYTSNLVMADALFNSLSILWITQLLWIVQRPRPYMILTHATLLILTFTIRYNALYYPAVAALAFLLSRLPLKWKLTGIALPILLVAAFIYHTNSKMEAYCGVRQFSPFGGWKLANDALYMYAHVQPGASDTVPPKFRELDRMTREYYRISHDPGDLMQPDVFHGSPFMFAGYSPLMRYMYSQYGADSGMFLNFQKWSRMGPLYTSYGSYLARKYPMAFARWFLWPNLTRYALPPREIYMTITPFFLREDELGPEATRWFGVTTLTVDPAYINLRLSIFAFYPILFGLIHLCFILGLLSFTFSKGWKSLDRPGRRCLITLLFLWACDLGFSLFAAAIVMRYQILIVIIECALALYFLEYLHRHADEAAGSPVPNGPSPV